MSSSVNGNCSLDSHNKRCNKRYYHSKRDKILKIIEKSSIALSSKIIAEESHVNYNTARSILKDLCGEGKIIQPYRGSYCSKDTYGVLFPQKVHNLRLRCFVSEDIEHWEYEQTVGDVKVKVCFGEARRKITGSLVCDAGISKDACLSGLNWWFDVAEKHLGRSLGDVEITTTEFNRDYVGFQLDGSLHCYTRNDLYGFVERLYQRDDCVRHEYKVSRKMSVTQLEALLDRSVLEVGLSGPIHMLIAKFDALVQAYKFQNRKILETENKLDVMVTELPRLRRINLLLDYIVTVLSELAEDPKKKLTEGFTCVESMSWKTAGKWGENMESLFPTQILHV